MFGSTNPFGQSSASPFGSQSPFGQTSNTANNPFAPKPFGSTTPFGLQTGGSIFGSTSTGVFGASQASSPFSSTTAFGASSSPAFGASSSPAFGVSSTPTFGGSSLFGQKPVFGGFGSASQSTPFGTTTQQSQPAFGSNLFGSTSPFGASSQPTFGASSTPGFGSTTTTTFGSSSTPFGASSNSAFGATSAPGFGATSTPTFGAATAPAFGSTSTSTFGGTSTPAFGSGASPAFGGTGTSVFGSGGAFGASSASLFGSSSTPAFGASSTPAFGASSTPAFGASSTPAFGSSSSPAFGASSTPAFGASSTPSFSFASGPAFGQSSSAFGSSSFVSSPTPFGGQGSPFGPSAATPTFGSSGFGQSTFGAQRGGSRVAPYTPTTETESSGGQPGKLESISAMPVYKDKSHEELRWEDYQLGDKGGPTPPGQAAGSIGFGMSTVSSNPFAPSTSFGQSSASQFSSISTNPNPFASKPPGFGVSTTSAFNTSPFGSSSSPFPSASFSSTSTTAFAGSTSPSMFGTSSTSTFGSTSTLFNSTAAPGTASPFPNMFSNTQPSLSFASTTPVLGQTGSAFGQNTTPSFNPPNLFNSPSTGFGGLFSSTPSLVPSSNPAGFGPTTSSAFQLPQPSQSTGAFGFSNTGQTLSAGTSGFAGVSGIFGQSPFGQSSATQNSVALQSMPVTNPFGTLPVMPQMSIGRAGTSPSVQYGIASMPIVDKPVPVRISSLLTSRHLLQRRTRLPARKYNPKHDSPKVPFFSEEETPSTPKADALFIPRENPRALVIHPTDQLPLRASADKMSLRKDASSQLLENGNSTKPVDASPSGGSSAGGEKKNFVEDGMAKGRGHHARLNQKPNGVQEDNSIQREDSYVAISGPRAGEAAIVYEHGADIEALMPKLRRSDYYTEPRIQELAAKERAEPGYCCHVKDFVVGRHGFGHIKFLGETDVRCLDLESLVQFNNREVIVYMDDSKKPPVGQGLNKPAEVVLLNIKCFDKKTGRQYTEGPKIEKYKEMLQRKAKDQGAEFVSYDPVKGEWKFKVKHFSKYMLEYNEEAEWETEAIGVC
ncbi:hypothetical protein K2173_021475 [Erythroxylum novogranatense]|uniref:Nucleoporin autopeptidase n=1 Tax=Erythroxylum novogranatense TaxID=1862640 RepID=A0AAV8TMY4_9ROSI|nr:hypothetical protein K2173_021475 [Erythroxylum novogranatense]